MDWNLRARERWERRQFGGEKDEASSFLALLIKAFKDPTSFKDEGRRK